MQAIIGLLSLAVAKPTSQVMGGKISIPEAAIGFPVDVENENAYDLVRRKIDAVLQERKL